MTRAPAHAGRLHPWETSVFGLVLALMATYVVIVTISAAGAAEHVLAGPSGTGAQAVAAGLPRAALQSGTIALPRSGAPGRPGSGSTASKAAAARQGDTRLAAALGPISVSRPGQFAAGVIDLTTGTRALYRPGLRLRTAGIVTADILAALLLQHQQAGTRLTSSEQALAGAMIRDGNEAATGVLWQDIGRTQGLIAANKVLGLDHTQPSPTGRWNLTQTTVADQLRLLSDLVSARSPVAAAGRAYELGLLAGTAGPARGVAAAGDGASDVVNGWHDHLGRWIVTSLRIADRGGQRLLIVILSRGSPSRAGGLSLTSDAAIAAAGVLTRPR